MNIVRIALRIAPFVVIAAAVTGCVESQAASAREPRSSVLVTPSTDNPRAGIGYAPKYAGAAPRIDRLRQ